MTERYNVIGCQIVKSTMQGAVSTVCEQAKNKKGGYVCFTNVHASVMAVNDAKFMSIVNDSFMSLPDGKPVYWVGRMLGNKEIEQVPGPDFFEKLVELECDPPLKHYFYGGSPETLEKLVDNLTGKYANLNIVGKESPSYSALSEQETDEALARIRSAEPDVVWVGLGAPKQEFWMSEHWQQLKPAILLGVGAAFDFHADVVQRAPRWMQKAGLEWLHRLMQEPGRLWKRYLYTNSLFVLQVLKQFVMQILGQKKVVNE